MYHYRGNKPILNTSPCTSFIINFTWNSESALKKWLLLSGLPSGGRAGTTVITPICVFSRTFNHFPILHLASNGHQLSTPPYVTIFTCVGNDRNFFCDCDVYQIGKFGRLHIFISSINSLYHLNLKLHNATMSCDFGKLGLWIDVHSNLKAVSLTSWMSVAVKDM